MKIDLRLLTLMILLAFSLPAFSEISRDHVLRTGVTERLVENPPENIAARAEAIIDAIWSNDHEAFVLAAAAPETSRLSQLATTAAGLEKIVKEFREFYPGDLRTMRHPPKWPTPTAERPWVRVSVQRLDKGKVRGQFILVFSGEDWALEHVTLNLYAHADLPSPDPDDEADIVRDRQSVAAR